jgi:two-component system, NarL family, sensor histidine kinase UhpB
VCRYGVRTPFLAMQRSSDSLVQRTVAANVLLVTATLFAASVAGSLDVIDAQGRQFLVLALAVLVTLLVNILVLRRRFRPLERLIARVEAIDPADPSAFAAGAPGGEAAEVDRLARSFRRLLDRIEAERNRAGRMVLAAQEEERRRLARDLHDEANQALAAVSLRLEALRHDTPPELAGKLAETKRLATQAMRELVGLARQLRPAALDDHGLAPALEAHVRRFGESTGIDATFAVEGDLDGLGSERELVVYRVAQEALTNAARHAAPASVAVALAALPDGGAELRVRDDGRGFDAPRPDGLGLQGMSERARLVGGELELRSRPGGGTLVVLRVPREGEEPGR